MFLSPTTGCLLLFGFGLMQLADLTGVGSAAYVSAALAALSILWMCLGRSTVSLRWLAGPVVWAVAFLTAERGLGELIGHVDLMAASWRGRALFGFFALITLVLQAVPLLCLSSRLRGRVVGLLRRNRPIPAWLAGASLTVTFVAECANQWTDWERLRERLVLRACLLAVAVLAGWLAIASEPTTGPDIVRSPMTSSRRTWVWLGLILGGFAVLAAFVRSDAGINRDALSYFTIARSYAEGHPVVRGYWSPLLPWLMAPIIALGSDPFVAFRIVAGVAGALWALLAALIGERAGLPPSSRLALAGTVCLIILWTAFYPQEPDLLSAAVVGLYLWLMTSPTFARRPVLFGILAGLVGALGYYAKYYNYAFFLVHFPVSCLILEYRSHGRSVVIRTIAAGLASFTVAVLPWVLAVSARYGHLTMTTSSAIGRAIVGPSGENHPYGTRLYTEPEDILFPGEDPQLRHYQDVGWSPLESVENLKHQIRLTWSNASEWLGTTLGPLGPIPALGLLALGLTSLTTPVQPIRSAHTRWILFTVVLYAGGYLSAFAAGFLRYYYPILPLLMIGLLQLVDALSQPLRRLFRPRWAQTAAGLLALALPTLSFSWFWPILSSLRTRENTCLRDASAALSASLVPPMVGTIDQESQISYYTSTRTYGVIPADWPAAEVDRQLTLLGVRSILTTPQDPLTSTLIGDFGYEMVAQADACDLHLVLLRPPG
jgi:4-amino-4-deoxy-L-arabinose transferase-like glycosyltransferase